MKRLIVILMLSVLLTSCDQTPWRTYRVTFSNLNFQLAILKNNIQEYDHYPIEKIREMLDKVGTEETDDE